jgi:hypothetical protein
MLAALFCPSSEAVITLMRSLPVHDVTGGGTGGGVTGGVGKLTLLFDDPPPPHPVAANRPANRLTCKRVRTIIIL